MSRRKHSKITRELPPEIVEAVNNLLVEGRTYQEIADWLQEMGHDVSKSSVGRYGKDFLTELERLRIIRDQAQAIVDDNPDRPATELTEAASTLATQLIIEALMAEQDAKRVDELTGVFRAIAQLERSAVAREKLKFDFNKGVDAATGKLKEALRREMSTDSALLEQVLDLVERTKEQVSV